MEDFNNLIRLLRMNGYNIVVMRERAYSFAKVSGKGIIGGFCNGHDEGLEASYVYINGKIAVDHVDCFDKWSKCPLALTIPTTDDEITFLLKQLRYWGTDEGFRNSNEYNFETYVKQYS